MFILSYLNNIISFILINEINIWQLVCVYADGCSHYTYVQ